MLKDVGLEAYYAELYLGSDDYVGCALRVFYRAYGAGNQRSAGQCRGSTFSVPDHGRRSGVVDGPDGDCQRSRTDSKDDQRNQSFFGLHVS